MKNKLSYLLLSSLLLVGCNPSNSNSNNSENKQNSSTIKDVTDEQLRTTEENFIIYDNKMTMDPVNGAKEIADPFVYRFNGWYYLYPTTNGQLQRGYKSQDLYNWEPVSNGELRDGYVYDYTTDSNRPAAQTPFAPEVIYYNGKFYMVSSPNGQGHYIFESDSPEGPFYAITENIGRNIDGNFFINSDEEIFMFGASSGAIIAYGLEDDFQTFKTNDDGSFKQNLLTNCRVGGWNEGSYMLQRHGDYYMTYCGSHYLSKSYRVDYAFAEEGANLYSASAYTREDTVLVSTDDDFNGLGHSSTVLGPDMDSYIIAYHDLNTNASRNFDLSRLSFNGSMMVANSVVKEGAVGVDLPPFFAYDDSEMTESGSYLFSDSASEDTFTAEFNVIGEGKMIFGYQDDSNYSYIEYKDNDITINTITNGTDSEVYKIDLINEYDTDVYHSFRIQHRDGIMNFYFDNIEKAHSIEARFKGGKIGYFKNNTYDEIGYTAFSNVAVGSSDNEYYADTVSLANGFDEDLSYFQNGYEYLNAKKGHYTQVGNNSLVLKTEGDHATYRMYAREDNTYSINVRIPSVYLGTTYGLRVDDGEIIETTLTSDNLKYETGDVYLSLGEVDLEAGCHNISIYNRGEEIAFSKVEYEVASYADGFEMDFNSSTDFTDFHTYNVNKNLLSENGLDSDDQDLQAVVSDYEYNDVTVEASFTLYELQNTGIAGIMFNVSDFSKNYNGDGDSGGNANMFRGYRLSIQAGYIYLEAVDFNFGKTLKSKSFKFKSGETYTLTAEVNGNQITCYLDGEELFTVAGNIGNLNGKVGIVASDCDSMFHNFYVS